MKRYLILIVGAAMVLSLLAAGCGGSEDPATKIDNAYTNSLNYKTVHADYDVNLKVDGDASAIDESLASLLPLDLTVSGSGDVDNSDKENPKLQATVKIEGLADIISNASAASGSDEMEAIVGSGMIETLLSDLEVKLIDKVFYLKIMGSWYEADTSELASEATGDTEDLDTTCFQDAMEEKLVPSAVLSDIEEAGDEDVDGESTKHYKAKVDVGKVTDVLAEIARDCDQAEAAGALEGGSSDLAAMFKTLDVDLWIDGDDNLRKMTLTVELDTAAISGMGDVDLDSDQEEALESLSVSMTATMVMSNFDEDVSIDAPEDTLPFDELLGLGSGLGGMGSGFGDRGGFDGSGTTTDGDTGTSTGSSTTSNPYSY